MLRENGVSYHSVGTGGDTARPWRLDLLPMLITAADWAVVAEGIGTTRAITESCDRRHLWTTQSD